MKVAVVYWTNTGNTEAMAEEIALGARDAGAEVLLRTFADTTPAEVLAADRIVLGCPAMGVEELEESEVEPFFKALLPHLRKREIGLFGSCGWSHGQWLQKWANRIYTAGGLFLAKPVRATGYPGDDALAECRKFGEMMGTVYEDDE